MVAFTVKGFEGLLQLHDEELAKMERTRSIVRTRFRPLVSNDKGCVQHTLSLRPASRQSRAGPSEVVHDLGKFVHRVPPSAEFPGGLVVESQDNGPRGKDNFQRIDNPTRSYPLAVESPRFQIGFLSNRRDEIGFVSDQWHASQMRVRLCVSVAGGGR
jgi:hypothetical protein